MSNSVLVVCCTLGLLLGLGACKEVPADRLYALQLDHAPTSDDWQRALPRVVTLRGGQVHKLNPLPDIDEDTVHTTTASCHHGAALPEPVAVDMRAFYTARDLYLRLSWRDATRDDAIRQWTFDGSRWHSSPAAEDGLGLLFDPARQFPRFNCSYACHIDDFGVSGDSFHASNRMKLAAADTWLDLWNWKAQRTGRYGFADDRYLDQSGMHGDVPGELFRANSRMQQDHNAGAEAFGEGDGPIYDGDGMAVGKEFRPAGSTAPGYLTERPVAGRGDVAATADYRGGRWTLLLHRALDTGDPRDVRFVPGAPEGVAFGLSVMDDTLKEHYASSTQETLILLPPEGH